MVRWPQFTPNTLRVIAQAVSPVLGVAILVRELLLSHGATDPYRVLAGFALIGLPFPLAADSRREKPPE